MILFRNRLQPLFESIFEELHNALDADSPVDHRRDFASTLKIDTALTAASNHSCVPDFDLRSMNRRLAYEENQYPTDEIPPIGESESVLRELGLAPGLRAHEVAALRRHFASRNHPDRMPAELRSLATRRMMIANALLDSYSKKSSTR